MAKAKLPETIYVSVEGGGKETYLQAATSEIEVARYRKEVEVGEYVLRSSRKLRVVVEER